MSRSISDAQEKQWMRCAQCVLSSVSSPLAYVGHNNQSSSSLLSQLWYNRYQRRDPWSCHVFVSLLSCDCSKILESAPKHQQCHVSEERKPCLRRSAHSGGLPRPLSWATCLNGGAQWLLHSLRVPHLPCMCIRSPRRQQLQPSGLSSASTTD